MPAIPQSFLSFGASLLTVRTALRLRRRRSGPASQRHVLDALTPRLAAADFGRRAGIEPRMSYRAFQSRLAPRTYADFAPEIARMQRGETDVLWPGRCSRYALSAGTAGAPKRVPLTPAMCAHVRRASLEALLYYTVRTGHGGVFRGSHLQLGVTPGLAGATAADGPLADTLSPWLARQGFHSPPEIARLADWTERLRALARASAARDVTLLAGLPPALLQFAYALRREQPHRTETLPHLWPNLECIVHTGLPLAPFADELHELTGPRVAFHETYAAAEGYIAAQDADPADGLRLMTGAGLFFEFLPLRDFDPSRLAQLGPKALPLDGVQPGVDYVLLLTTPAGFCRYVIGDIVRFTSLEPPRLVFVGRTELQLQTFDEQVSEKDLTDALSAMCARHQWRVVNFHVAPLPASSLTGSARGRHEWWIELKSGTLATPTGPVMAAELDLELQVRNPAYAARRRDRLAPPVVRLLMPGAFENWLRHRGLWSERHKLPRSRPDREIAAQLAQMARFTEDQP